MAKAPADEGRGAQAKAAVQKGARFTGSMLFWIIAILLLAWLVWAFFKPSDLVMGSSKSVDELVNGYQQFVRPYAPPGSLSPSQDTVNAWLEYFDDDSQDFFNDNVEKLSYLMHINNVDEWHDFAEGKHRMEAVRFLLNQGPLRGGAISSKRYSDDNTAATVDIFTGSKNVTVPVIKVGDNWHFDDFMGMLPELQQRVQAVNLPTQGNE